MRCTGTHTTIPPSPSSQDFLNPSSQNQDPFHPQFSLPASNPVGYPGFDPLGYSKVSS